MKAFDFFNSLLQFVLLLS